MVVLLVYAGWRFGTREGGGESTQRTPKGKTVGMGGAQERSAWAARNLTQVYDFCLQPWWQRSANASFLQACQVRWCCCQQAYMPQSVPLQILEQLECQCAKQGQQTAAGQRVRQPDKMAEGC